MIGEYFNQTRSPFKLGLPVGKLLIESKTPGVGLVWVGRDVRDLGDVVGELRQTGG